MHPVQTKASLRLTTNNWKAPQLHCVADEMVPAWLATFPDPLAAVKTRIRSNYDSFWSAQSARSTRRHLSREVKTLVYPLTRSSQRGKEVQQH